MSPGTRAADEARWKKWGDHLERIIQETYRTHHYRQLHRGLAEITQAANLPASAIFDAFGIRIGLDTVDGKNLEIFSPRIGTPLLERGLIDEVDLHVLPRLLGDGTACTTSRMGPGANCRTWVGDDPNAATNLRFRTTYQN